MPFCSKCGSSLTDDARFCGKCGASVVLESKVRICKNCGNQIESGMSFCTQCGTKVTEESETPANRNVNPIPTPTPTPEPKTTPTSNEYVLYQRKMVGYYTALRQISGELLVTNKKIVYTPMAIYVLFKPVTIYMSEVLKAERAKVMGINLCIRITTKDNKSYTFSLGLQDSNNIQHIVDSINDAK